jgi:hypothetical protein
MIDFFTTSTRKLPLGYDERALQKDCATAFAAPSEGSPKVT